MSCGGPTELHFSLQGGTATGTARCSDHLTHVDGTIPVRVDNTKCTFVADRRQTMAAPQWPITAYSKRWWQNGRHIRRGGGKSGAQWTADNGAVSADMQQQNCNRKIVPACSIQKVQCHALHRSMTSQLVRQSKYSRCVKWNSKQTILSILVDVQLITPSTIPSHTYRHSAILLTIVDSIASTLHVDVPPHSPAPYSHLRCHYRLL